MALLVNAKVGPSSIQGLGLFAEEFIPKGTPIWRFDARIDSTITPEDLAGLPEPAKKQALKYSYLCKDTGLYVLCGDDSRHMNHADEPNTVSTAGYGLEGDTITCRDIEPGEELTTNYNEYDVEGSSKLGLSR